MFEPLPKKGDGFIRGMPIEIQHENRLPERPGEPLGEGGAAVGRTESKNNCGVRAPDIEFRAMLVRPGVCLYNTIVPRGNCTVLCTAALRNPSSDGETKLHRNIEPRPISARLTT